MVTMTHLRSLPVPLPTFLDPDRRDREEELPASILTLETEVSYR